MLVINDERIAKCSELRLFGNTIIGYIEGCKGCSFVVMEFDTGKEAAARFNKEADRFWQFNGENYAVDFRSKEGE